MASVDGSYNPLATSDEQFDFECDPCKAGGVKREARHYCENCSEYLCDQCEGHHKNLTLTRNHKIVSGNQLPSTRSTKVLIYCGCNKNQDILFYCADHKDVVCDACKTIKHHKCNINTNQDESASYSTKTFESLLSKVNSMKDELDRMRKDCESNNKELKHMKESCINDIIAFRNEINTLLDRLQEDMLRRLDSYEEEFEKRINQQVSTSKSAFSMIEADIKLLESAKTDGRNTVMFASDVRVSKSLEDYKQRLDDIASQCVKPVLSFHQNEKFSNFFKEIKHFGEIRIKEDSSGKNAESVVFLDKKVQSTREVNVRENDDSETVWISGIAVIPNGYIVLCDFSNYKIKLVDSSWTLKGSLKFPTNPWDITVIDDNNVIITRPNDKQLQYIQVFPVLKTDRVLQLDKKCWGVAVADDTIFVTCHKYSLLLFNPGEGEVRILDFNGNTLRRLGINQDGSFMFTRPYYISVSSSGEKVFVSDWYTDAITCMTGDGHVIYTYMYTDSHLLSPTGILCDGEGNVVCLGCRSHNVQVITADGKKYETLLLSREGLKNPHAIKYSKKDNSFIVGCPSDIIHIYKLNSA